MKALLLIGLFLYLQRPAKCEIRVLFPTTLCYVDQDRPEGAVQRELVLDAIQQKIEKALQTDRVHKEAKALLTLEMVLEQDETLPVALKNYWIAYINYLKTLRAREQKDLVAAEQADEKGIKVLEANTTKSADDYALLALLKGLSFYFAPETEAMRIYLEIEGLLTAGLALDKNNIRLQYVQGVLDFHTPREYGGGYKVERFLMNAIEQPELNFDDQQQPTWGKEEAYDLLIQYYLQTHKNDSAKKYFNEGRFAFPNSRAILQHQGAF